MPGHHSLGQVLGQGIAKFTSSLSRSSSFTTEASMWSWICSPRRTFIGGYVLTDWTREGQYKYVTAPFCTQMQTWMDGAPTLGPRCLRVIGLLSSRKQHQFLRAQNYLSSSKGLFPPGARMDALVYTNNMSTWAYINRKGRTQSVLLQKRQEECFSGQSWISTPSWQSTFPDLWMPH